MKWNIRRAYWKSIDLFVERWLKLLTTTNIFFLSSNEHYQLKAISNISVRELHVLKIEVRAVVVVQLVERSLPTPEIHGSNPVIGKFYKLLTVFNLYWKDENKEKEAGRGPFLIKSKYFLFYLTKPVKKYYNRLCFSIFLQKGRLLEMNNPVLAIASILLLNFGTVIAIRRRPLVRFETQPYFL